MMPLKKEPLLLLILIKDKTSKTDLSKELDTLGLVTVGTQFKMLMLSIQ